MSYTYNTSNLTNLGQLKKLASRVKTELDAINSSLDNAIKAASYSDNTLKLFRGTDTTGTAAFTFNLPEEMFLDQTKTEFVPDFEWSSTDYPGSTDPDLDGKPVMVLAVKGDATNPTYSFLDMEALVDTYTANDDSVTVGSYKIAVKIDSTAGNALQLVSGKGLRVDISGKADKVANATSGNFAGLDSNGNLTDSGSKAADFATADHTHSDKADKVDSATNGDLAGLDSNGNLTDSGIAATNVLVKPSTATTDNLAAFDSNKQPVDSGIAKGDVVTKIASPTANNLVKQDSNGKIADAGVAVGDVQQKLASGAFTSGNFRTSNATGFAQDAGYGLASDTNVDDMIHDVWGDPET